MRTRLTALMAAGAVAVAFPACGDDDGKGVGEAAGREGKKAGKAAKREGKEAGQDIKREAGKAKKKVED